MKTRRTKQFVVLTIAAALTFTCLAKQPLDQCLLSNMKQKLEIELAGLQARVAWGGKVPQDILVSQHELRHFGAAEIKYLKQGGKLKYVVDREGQLSIIYSSVNDDLSSGSLLLIHDKNHPESNPFLATEYGEIKYEPSSKSIVMSPKFDIELSEEEQSAIVQNSLAEEKAERIARVSTGLPKTKVMHCTDILNKQSSGASFVKSKLFADNMVATTAIITTEALGADRLKTEKGREVILADLIGTNYSSLIGASVGKALVLRGVGKLGDTAVRAATAATMITIQNGVYREVIQSDASSSANAISTFDAAHFAVRLPINRMMDRYILEKVPTLFFNACLIDSKARLFIGPTAIRLYERYGSTVLYYGARKAIVNE